MNNERATKVDVPFSSGVRQDLNPQTAPPGTLVNADNVEFDQLARLVRRDGFVPVSLSTISKTNTSSFPVRRFAQGPGGEHLYFTDQNTHCYFPALDKVCEAGLDAQRSTIRGNLVDVLGVVADEVGDILFADACAVANWAVYVYVHTNASLGVFQVCADVVDTNSGARVITRAVLGTTNAAVQPRCVVSVASQVVFAVWPGTSSGVLQYSRINLGTGTLAWSTAATLVSDANTSPPAFDVDQSSAGWLIAYAQTNAGNRVSIIVYDSGGTPTPLFQAPWRANNGTTDWSPTALAVCGDALVASSQVHVAGYDPVAFMVETKVFNFGLGAIANSRLDPGLDHAKWAVQMALGRRNSTTTQLCFSNYTSTTTSTNPRGHLHCYSMADTAAIGRDTIFANYSLGSKFYRDARNGGLFAMGRFDDPSGFQSHYLLLDFGNATAIVGGYGAPVPVLHVANGRVNLKADNALTGIGGMADLSGKRAGLFQFVGTVNIGASAISGRQVTAYTLESIGTRRFLSTPCQGESVIGGATPLMYDGQRLVELSFYSYPSANAGNIATATTSGSMAQGVYQYRFVYEWTDAKGNRHQSPASPAVTVDMSGVSFAGNVNKVTFTIPAYHATRKQVQFPVSSGAPVADTAAPVRVIGYRTKVNQTAGPFYRLPGGAINNTATALDDGAFVDSNTDGNIAVNEVLYAQAGGQGKLASTAPPPSLMMTTHAQRLWGLDGENPERIWCTKVLEDEEAPGYNPALQVEIPGAGRINGIGGQDGKLYALATNGVYLASYGDGPDNAGGGAFPSPQLITTNANCTEPRSVLVGMDGIYFVGDDQWGTGIYVIRRGDGQPVSIGKRVRNELAAYPVCRGVVNRTQKARTEFLFVDSDTAPTAGAILYYHHDYLDQEGLGQWTVARVFGGEALECLGQWDDLSVVSDGTFIGRQVLGTVRDFGSATPVVQITTADIRAFGLVGYGKISGVTLLGTQSVTDPIKIEASYDSGYSYADAFQYPVSPEDVGQPVLRRFDTQSSKLSEGGAIRIRLSDPTLGEDLPGTTFFHGISVEVEPLGGNARLPTEKRG